MTFQPIIVGSGIAGWNFLQRTREKQEAALGGSSVVQRDEEYFRQKIGQVRNAENLVDDRRLLRISLTAFGLEDDINNRHFIKKVLQDGTIDPKGLARRLSDKRYLELAKAFSFDVQPPRTSLSTFANEIFSAYKAKKFESSVGDVSPDMRLALALDRDLGKIARQNGTENAQWFNVMANRPLRSVFERVLNLPASVGMLDIDRQLRIFKDGCERYFGNSSISQFTNPDKVEDLRRQFLVRGSDASFSPAGGPSSAALTILSNMALTRTR